MSSAVLEQFWGLSSLDQKQRIQSCERLLDVLTVSQKPASDGELSGDLNYTIKRLVRGLASSRDGARQGFTLALTEALMTFPAASVEDVLKLIQVRCLISGHCGKRMGATLFAKKFPAFFFFAIPSHTRTLY
jgi:DNA polymerase phi